MCHCQFQVLSLSVALAQLSVHLALYLKAEHIIPDAITALMNSYVI